MSREIIMCRRSDLSGLQPTYFEILKDLLVTNKNRFSRKFSKGPSLKKYITHYTTECSFTK